MLTRGRRVGFVGDEEKERRVGFVDVNYSRLENSYRGRVELQVEGDPGIPTLRLDMWDYQKRTYSWYDDTLGLPHHPQFSWSRQSHNPPICIFPKD
jgi:hypothetical protein